MCGEATHQLRRVGVYWILMGCLRKTLSLSLLLYLIPSQACGLVSCEHTSSIKDLFISLLRLCFASRCEKGSFTEAVQSNSHSFQFISYCQLDLTGSLWESRCLSLMLLLCGLWAYAGGTMCHVPACLQGLCQTMLPLNTQHPDTHAHTCSYIQTCLRWSFCRLLHINFNIFRVCKLHCHSMPIHQSHMSTSLKCTFFIL